MQLKRIPFNELELDSDKKFSLNFGKNNIAKQVHFSPQKSFIMKLEAFVKEEKGKRKKKQNEYNAIVELLNFFRTLIAVNKNEKNKISLNKILLISEFLQMILQLENILFGEKELLVYHIYVAT